MLIGVPAEIKNNEFRVGLVPSSVRELVSRGHEVIVQRGAGIKYRSIYPTMLPSVFVLLLGGLT